MWASHILYGLVLAAGIASSGPVEDAGGYSANSEALRYFAGGTLLLLICFRGVRNEQRGVTILVSGVAGFVCVLVAVTMYLIGDLSHLDAAAAKTMAIETTIRKGTPPGSIAIGSECSKQLDCVSGSVCARFNGVLRCYLPCEPDGSCPAPGRCGKIGRDMVCVQ